MVRSSSVVIMVSLLQPVAALASVNPFASDLAAAHLMGYEPEEVGTVKAAVKRGLCPKTVAELTLDGEPLEHFKSRFRRPDASAGGFVKQIPTIFGGTLQQLLAPRPRVNRAKCIGCGACMRNCPASTIEMTDKKAHIKPKACIKCYCCQEFCPAEAVEIKKLFLFR